MHAVRGELLGNADANPIGGPVIDHDSVDRVLVPRIKMSSM